MRKLTRKPRTAEEFIAEADVAPEHLIPEKPPQTEDHSAEPPTPVAESPTVELQKESGKEVSPQDSSQDSQPETPITPQKQKRKKRMPWDHSSVRDDVMKVFNLRLPEPAFLKLKYISEHSSFSMQSFIQKVLLPAINSKVSAILRAEEKKD